MACTERSAKHLGREMIGSRVTYSSLKPIPPPNLTPPTHPPSFQQANFPGRACRIPNDDRPPRGITPRELFLCWYHFNLAESHKDNRERNGETQQDRCYNAACLSCADTAYHTAGDARAGR